MSKKLSTRFQVTYGDIVVDTQSVDPETGEIAERLIASCNYELDAKNVAIALNYYETHKFG
jgi:hypothetical protein